MGSPRTAGGQGATLLPAIDGRDTHVDLAREAFLRPAIEQADVADLGGTGLSEGAWHVPKHSMR